jgi:Zn-dependent protease
MRHTVYQKPEESSEYREYGGNTGDMDYSHPDYYQPPARQSSRPVQPLDPYNPYSDYESVAAAATDSPYRVEQMQAYRGPSSMEGYTLDAGIEQREAATRGSAEGGKQRKKGLAGIGGAIAAAIAWLLKLKGLLFLLKFGWAGVSALISIAIYAIFFGWAFAIGLVALLFIHEMGHALVMKLKGIPMGAMIFVPMLGAAVTMRQSPQNAHDEAEVGIAGPVAGAIASSVYLAIAEMHASSGTYSFWAPLAYFGFFMNLFNLIPIVPFDGGRVLAAIDKRVWIIGFVALLAFQIWTWIQGNFSPWLLLFVIMAATQLWTRGKTPDTPQAKAYYAVPVGTRIILSVLYFGLAAVLVLGMSIAHSIMPVVH